MVFGGGATGGRRPGGRGKAACLQRGEPRPVTQASVNFTGYAACTTLYFFSSPRGCRVFSVWPCGRAAAAGGGDRSLASQPSSSLTQALPCAYALLVPALGS